MQKTIFPLGFTIIATLIADTVTKFWAQNFLAAPRDLWPGLQLALTQNPALAFGLPLSRPLLMLGSLLALGSVLWFWWRETRRAAWPAWLGFGLILGGGLGNFYERLVLGHVTDFIALGPIPNFNVADVALTAGALTLLIFHKRVFIR